MEPDAESPSIQPVLTYTVLPPDTDLNALAERAAAARTAAAIASEPEQGTESDGEQSKNAESEADSTTPPMPSFDDLTLHKVTTALRELEDEDPCCMWSGRSGLREVHVQLMGAVQLEIIQQELHDRFGLDVVFGPGGILYRETSRHRSRVWAISNRCGITLRRTSGWSRASRAAVCRFATAVSENVLDRNWQRADHDASGGARALGRADRRTPGRCQADAGGRSCALETYRGRRFPAGHVPGRTAGADGAARGRFGATVGGRKDRPTLSS